MEKWNGPEMSCDLYKIRRCLTILNELKVENIHLKNQLSEIIRGQVNQKFVEQAEWFQQRFVEKDQVIDLLRYEMRTLRDNLSGPEILSEEKARQFVILEKDIEHLAYQFRQMKVSFNGLLSQPPGD